LERKGIHLVEGFMDWFVDLIDAIVIAAGTGGLLVLAWGLLA